MTLDNETLRRHLGRQGRATVERLYGWDAIGRRMIDVYLQLPHAHLRDSLAVHAPASGAIRAELG
jgi:hypothetical protein